MKTTAKPMINPTAIQTSGEIGGGRLATTVGVAIGDCRACVDVGGAASNTMLSRMTAE